MRQLAGTNTKCHWAYAAPLARLISGRAEYMHAHGQPIMNVPTLSARNFTFSMRINIESPFVDTHSFIAGAANESQTTVEQPEPDAMGSPGACHRGDRVPASSRMPLANSLNHTCDAQNGARVSFWSMMVKLVCVPIRKWGKLPACRCPFILSCKLKTRPGGNLLALCDAAR